MYIGIKITLEYELMMVKSDLQNLQKEYDSKLSSTISKNDYDDVQSVTMSQEEYDDVQSCIISLKKEYDTIYSCSNILQKKYDESQSYTMTLEMKIADLPVEVRHRNEEREMECVKGKIISEDFSSQILENNEEKEKLHYSEATTKVQIYMHISI
jgi:carboxypeptidase C (cathepsin A)